MSSNLAIQESLRAQPKIDPLGSPNLSVRIPIEDGSAFSLDEAREVLHRWIREGSLSDELMIDVATYAHLRDGPKLILICHEAQYAIDERGGKLWLVYSKRRRDDGTFEERLRRALGKLGRAADLLRSSTALRFDTSTIDLTITDGLRAPNTPPVFAEVLPAVTEVLRASFSNRAIDVAHQPESRAFSLRAGLSKAPTPDELASL